MVTECVCDFCGNLGACLVADNDEGASICRACCISGQSAIADKAWENIVDVVAILSACEQDIAAEFAEDSLYVSSIGKEADFLASLRVHVTRGEGLTDYETRRLVAAYDVLNMPAGPIEEKRRRLRALEDARRADHGA